MEQIKVSVIVPVYNGARYLDECIRSLLAQTLKDIEIIFVDDGSTDESTDIISRYMESNSKVKLIRENNRGAGFARNKGLSKAVGKYLSFLDCDDFYEPDMLLHAYERAEATMAEIVIYKSDQYNTETDEYIYEKWAMIEWALPPYEPFSYREISTNIFKAFVGWAWDKLYLRQFVLDRELRFQEQRTSNDGLFVFSALCLAEKVATVREVLIHRRVDSDDSLSKTREKSWDNFYRMLLGIRETLESHGLYRELEKDYINYCLHFCLWNYNTLAEPTKSMLKEKLLKEWFDELQITDKAPEYFYNKYEYGQYEELLKMAENSNV